MKKFLVWLICLILLTQPVFAQSEKLIILNTNTGQNTDADTGQNAGAGEQNSSDTTENTHNANTQQTGNVDISAPSALLMEASTGQVIYEKDADSKRPPASVTKVMTLLLIFDALQEGKIHLEDEVTTSEYAASMGGSQVFLEPGEVQTVETLIKCISVASANDACVCMAEYICGNEQEFVNQMNERAKGLGMENTHFVNCNGLDADGHVTTARDIALMSRELIHTYPQIFDYCNIWMEDITHTTKKGSTQFGLTNTNKMIRQYEYATGLKTGSTSQAKFCISATARKDNTDMIAVIMAADDSKARMRDAIVLLNYGFGKCQKYQEDKVNKIPNVPVKHGVEKKVGAAQMELFSYVDVTGADLSTIKKIVKLKENATAPVRQGDKIGEVIYSLNGKEIGKVDILATEDVEEISYGSAMKEAVRGWTL